MKMRLAIFLVTLFLLIAWVATSPATVEWDVAGTLSLKEKPRDAAMSLNGKWIFVLTEKGEILIYSSDGKLEDTISVGKGVEVNRFVFARERISSSSPAAKTKRFSSSSWISSRRSTLPGHR